MADAPEEFEGYFAPDFFNRLTAKQEAMLRVLYDAEGPIQTDELIRRMEAEYGEMVDGSSGLSGTVAGLTSKHSKAFRRSIMSAQWTGDQFEWWLTLDDEQERVFRDRLSID